MINISVKTFKNNKFNNDFQIKFGKTIKIKGTKYDATNLTKLLDQMEIKFFKKFNKEISININEITTNVSDVHYQF